MEEDFYKRRVKLPKDAVKGAENIDRENLVNVIENHFM
jgi:hypothetical protein